jgi:hypothetical protein
MYNNPVLEGSDTSWENTQRTLVILSRRFGKTYAPHIQEFLSGVSGQHIGPIIQYQGSLKIGQIGYPETSVNNYLCTLCNFPEERRSQCVQLCVR